MSSALRRLLLASLLATGVSSGAGCGFWKPKVDFSEPLRPALAPLPPPSTVPVAVLYAPEQPPLESDGPIQQATHNAAE